MNPYLFVHRIKWPSILLVFGITALLDEFDVLPYGKSWPLYLIVLGVLLLAERALLSQIQPPAYPIGPSAGAPPTTTTSIVPAYEPTSSPDAHEDRR
jgi:hypothetical protein